MTKAGRESFGYDAVGRMLDYHGFTLEWNGEEKLLFESKGDVFSKLGKRTIDVYRHAQRASFMEARAAVQAGGLQLGGGAGIILQNDLSRDSLLRLVGRYDHVRQTSISMRSWFRCFL